MQYPQQQQQYQQQGPTVPPPFLQQQQAFPPQPAVLQQQAYPAGFPQQAYSIPHAHGHGQVFGRRLPTKDWAKDKPVSSVIATIYSGSSYDGLFREQTQEPPEEGLAVSLFEFSYGCLNTICKCLMGEDITGDPMADVVREFCVDVGRAEAQSVVLNFECCSHASDSGFGTNGPDVMKITKLFLDRQHMVMFGDFSLKALIGSWDAELLGPKPFIKMGEISNSFELKFDCETLKKCPSSQLVTVGELCDKGNATVHALGGTIMYTVDRQASDTTRYKLEVLTVAVKVDNQPPAEGKHRLCTLPTDHSVKGAAGHVLLRYPSPKAEGQEGLMLVSMGHWIELAKLDVNFESVIQHAQKTYGESYARNLSEQIRAAPPQMQMAQMQAYACSAVQKASPAFSSKSAYSG